MIGVKGKVYFIRVDLMFNGVKSIQRGLFVYLVWRFDIWKVSV